MISLFAFLAVVQSVNVKAAEGDVARIPPKAAPGFGALGGLGLVPTSNPTITYEGWIAPAKNPSDIEQERLLLQIPVYRGAINTLSVSLGGEALHFGDPPPLSTGVALPQNLWKFDLSTSFSHRIDEDKLIGGGLSFGSASDHPFASGDVDTVGGSLFYSWPASETNRWVVSVFFSNNNPILNYFPIPGFMYLTQGKTLIGMFGFPLNTVIWMPEAPWMFTLSIFGPTVHAEAAWGTPSRFQAFVGFHWLQQSFLLEDRPHPNDRLYFAQKKIPVGVRFPLWNVLTSEFSAGYAFARILEQGPHLGSDEDGRVSFGNTYYAAWNLRMIF